MPEAIHKYLNVFTTFWKSGVHEVKWTARLVYSVLVFQLGNNSKSTVVFRNRNKRHSEQNAIIFLREKLQENSLPSQTITWFVNYSPCRNCSERINEFIKEARTSFGVTIKVKMTFPFLYKIRRPSCEKERHQHLEAVSCWDHQENLEGLKQLESNGVSVCTFGEEDWEDLSRLLSLVHDPLLYPGSTRQAEDVLLKKDFHRLVRFSSSSQGGFY